MINEGKDSSLIKSIKSPSDTLTAVLDRKAKKYYLQKRGFQKLLGHRVELYDPKSKKSFIIHGGGHGVHPKRTEVMLFKNKSEGSRDGRNSPLFEQKVSNVRSADKYSITAAFNLIYKKNGLKYARYMVGIFSILRKGHGLQRCSSTGGGDSRGFTVAHEVDSQAKYISGNKLQCKSEDRSVS